MCGSSGLSKILRIAKFALILAAPLKGGLWSKSMNYSGDEILYGKAHAPALFKAYDDFAKEVNEKLRKRGIGRGFVCIQEEMNRGVFHSQQLIYKATRESNPEKRLDLIQQAEGILGETIWIAVRYLLKQKALTPGEIGVLSSKAMDIRNQYKKWIAKTERGITS